MYSMPKTEEPLSMYEDSITEGVKARVERTGEDPEDILQETLEENLKKHSIAPQEILKSGEIEESAENWDKAIRQVRRRLKKSQENGEKK